jgi:aminotransferase
MKIGLQEIKPDVANLAIGIPDISCPKEVKDILINAVEKSSYSYVPSKGTLQALSNMAGLIFPRTNFNYASELMLVNGAKFGIYLSLKTLTNAGDSVCLMEPYWLSYPDIAYSLGLNITSWKPNVNKGVLSFDLDELKRLLKFNSIKVLILNNPNNPAGHIFSKKWQEDLNRILIEHNVALLIDEVYKNLVFKENRLADFEMDGGNVVKVGSLSKSLSIPGLRIGYIKGSAEFITNADKFNQHISTCINALSMQLAEKITLETFSTFTSVCRKHYSNRFSIVARILEASHLPMLHSEASFYTLIDFSRFFKSGEDACSFLLDKVGILATPGLPYGDSFSGYVRICLTKPETLLEEKFNLLLKNVHAII